MFLVGIGFIVFVAGDTAEESVISGLCMALRTILPGAGVGSRIDGKPAGIVRLKVGGRPSRVGGMTFLTLHGEITGNVRWVGGAIVIFGVASGTFGRSVGIVAVLVALCAILNVVPLCKREKVVIEPLRTPVGGIHVMAIGTNGGKAGRQVVWVLCCCVIRPVTIVTVHTHWVEPKQRCRLVAVVTIGYCMGTRKRETGGLVHLHNIGYNPRTGVMALTAILSHGVVVNVGMAGVTVGFGLLKFERGVAQPALGLLMLTGEHKVGGVVIKCGMVGYIPTNGGVTDIAIDVEVLSVR